MNEPDMTDADAGDAVAAMSSVTNSPTSADHITSNEPLRASSDDIADAQYKEAEAVEDSIGTDVGLPNEDRSFHTMLLLHSKEFALPVEDDQEGSPRVLAAAPSEDEEDLPTKKLFDEDTDEERDTNKKTAAMPAERPSRALTDPPTMFFQELEEDEEDHSAEAAATKQNWHTRAILRIHKAVVTVLLAISGVAVRFPRITLIALSLLSLALIGAGLFTNFYVETETHNLWPPSNSLSLEHSYWIWENSYFNYLPLTMDIIIHKNGDTDGLLGVTGVERVFEVQDIFTNIGQYKQGCAYAELFKDFYWIGQCDIHSVSNFWNESHALFEETVDTDEDAIENLSSEVYPTGVLVDVNTIMGQTERNEKGTLTSAQSYMIRFAIPWSNVTLAFEEEALDRMLLLKEEWEARGDEFQMEVRSYSSYSIEFMRAIQNDLWLLPLAFVIVALFTVVFAFGKCDKVKSRGLLGIGAVVTIVASIMTSFGILFCIGVPFTTQTLMVPFIMFGIGLDDAFIIYQSYNRRSQLTDVRERIRSTIEDVGVGIFITSLTSMLAFLLGSFSDIPAVRWLCQYAYPCIGIDFLYQITFFIALVVLDERRIQQGRMDYCTCITVRQHDQEEDADEIMNAPVSTNATEQEQIHAADRLMTWWADQLLKSWVQIASFALFLTLMAGSIYCATQLRQEFDFVALVPHDSYLKTFFSARNSYTKGGGIYAQAVFREVDQSDQEVQQQMFDYIDELVTRGNANEPVYFWLKDFQLYSEEQSGNSIFDDMSFDEQVDQFLSVDIYYELYDNAIGIRPDGRVTETRVEIFINVETQDSKATTDMLSNMRAISASQPINQGSGNWKFFTYAGQYHLFEFYNRVIEELIFTSVMSVVAVSVIALFFIPHWTAILFVFPFISFLYVNMLGYLYLSGVQINAISYVTLVMSIGLMIDYIMHILMRYYESSGSRSQRVQETMSSMGSSIFLGAASTFLGVMCLSLSTSDILQDIFVAMVGIITFGVLNGLIFLPVALLHLGPQGKQDDNLELEHLSLPDPCAIDQSLTCPTFPDNGPPEPSLGTRALSPPTSPLSEYTA